MRITLLGPKAMSRAEVREALRKRMAAGMKKAAAFLVGKLKEVVGVQAAVTRTRGGQIRAAVKATPGAPPRRVSGAGQRSIKAQVAADGSTSVFAALWYMNYWEAHGHPWLRKTVDRYRDEFRRLALGG